jgi:RNA polymerase sigma-70 factor (ECF subfamily)
MSASDDNTEALLARVRDGDAAAVMLLFNEHRGRLRQMIAVRMDPRLRSRFDPSDVVQDTLTEASQRLAGYLDNPPSSFYPWLRRLAADRLARLSRDHIHRQKRSVTREVSWPVPLPDESVVELAERFADEGSTPSGRLAREELRELVRHALTKLNERDREVLALRFLEQLSAREVAEVLGSTEAAVNMRQLRALERMHARVRGEFGSGAQ